MMLPFHNNKPSALKTLPHDVVGVAVDVVRGRTKPTSGRALDFDVLTE